MTLLRASKLESKLPVEPEFRAEADNALSQARAEIVKIYLGGRWACANPACASSSQAEPLCLRERPARRTQNY